VSMDERPICFSPTQWPNSEGYVYFGYETITVTADGAIAHGVEPQFGAPHCAGGCDIRVEPGATIRGLIPYEALSDEEVVRSATTRTMVMNLATHACDADE
jgi:hypothetical protein